MRSTSQRRQDVANGTRWHELMVSVETPLRFWGKRGLDAVLEDKTQAYAELGYADAMHEGGRELIQLWFAYLNALAAEHNASNALELTTKMQRMTQVQLKHGEVSKLPRPGPVLRCCAMLRACQHWQAAWGRCVKRMSIKTTSSTSCACKCSVCV